MENNISIRAARAEDSSPACELVRDSITQLCKADHMGEPLTLQGWLANKSAANFIFWITTPGSNVLIAERGGEMIGVGAVRDDGEVMLNYVAPAARFQGVSSALLTAMEILAREKRAERMSLTTTETARRFHEARGYVAEEEEGDLFSEEQCGMTKEF